MVEMIKFHRKSKLRVEKYIHWTPKSVKIQTSIKSHDKCDDRNAKWETEFYKIAVGLFVTVRRRNVRWKNKQTEKGLKNKKKWRKKMIIIMIKHKGESEQEEAVKCTSLRQEVAFWSRNLLREKWKICFIPPPVSFLIPEAYIAFAGSSVNFNRVETLQRIADLIHATCKHTRITCNAPPWTCMCCWQALHIVDRAFDLIDLLFCPWPK